MVYGGKEDAIFQKQRTAQAQEAFESFDVSGSGAHTSPGIASKHPEGAQRPALTDLALFFYLSRSLNTGILPKKPRGI